MRGLDLTTPCRNKKDCCAEALHAHWKKYTLHFKHPARTSRGVMRHRDVWFLFLTKNSITGMGECAPLPGLSLDRIEAIEFRLDELCANPLLYIENPELLKHVPSLRFALEMAQLDLENGGIGRFFQTSGKSRLDINGLIWMGDSDFMLAQINKKLNEGWRCIKIKIGGLNFGAELKILQYIRQHHGPEELELRLDANGAFTAKNVKQRLAQLAEFQPHSIEQPVAAGQWNLLAETCRTSPIPIALDEELLPLVCLDEQARMLDLVQPQFIVLKPGLLGGFSASRHWIRLAEERNIGWWITSALESSAGLNAISQWAEKLRPAGFQGLGTGQLFSNNLPSPLDIKSGKLIRHNAAIWKEIHHFVVDWLHPSQTVDLQTSGSTGAPRTIAMKKKWLENSARLTAATFRLKPGDSAFLCLPPQYVAGKMMLVRALCLGLDLKVAEPSSDPLAGISGNIDFLAMTPMQLSQSILHGRLEKVKTVIVGGAQISPASGEQIQSQKTRIVETWGMTETASHVATRPLNGADKSDCFSALPGVRFSQDNRRCLIIRADHLGGKPIITNDVVELLNDHAFHWLGRHDNVINTGGVKVFPEVIEKKLAVHFTDRQFYIAGRADDILGEKVVLFIEGEPFQLPQEIRDSLTKYEKPGNVEFLDKFSHTSSGKIIRDTQSSRTDA